MEYKNYKENEIKEKDKERKNTKELKSKCVEKTETPIAAFKRSNLLMRSPPTRQASHPDENGKTQPLPDAPATERDSMGSTNEKDAPCGSGMMNDVSGVCSRSNIHVPMEESAVMVSEDIVSGTTKGSSPRLELIQKMRRMEEEAISQCKKTLDGMQRATNRQKNISIEVKTGISKMAELLDVIMNYRRTWKIAEGERAFSHLRKNAATLQLADAPTPKSAIPKRAATSPAIPTNIKKAKQTTPSTAEDDAAKKKGEDWQTVTRKKGKQRRKPKEKGARESKGRKPSSKPRKPEAVIVKPAEGRSYADVLRDLRARMVIDDSASIRSIRKTMSGAILLECGKGEKIAPEFVNQLRNTVRETAHIEKLKPTATVEIRDLDSLTEREEVESAVRKMLANPEEQMRTKITSPNTREQVRAFITLSVESASRLVEAGDILIGFIRAKVRACEEIKRCYRCLGTGHLQSNCTGPDRKNVCIRCGETGHKMKECKAAPKCILCAEAKRAQKDHLPGSRRCPMIRKK